MSTSTKPVKSICHCGAIVVTLTHVPEYVNECQCTICRRYGAAWGYYQSNELQVEQKGEGTRKYVWGDKKIEFHFCANCGCVVYWWGILPEADGTHGVGVNTRNINPVTMARVERRIQFDTVVEALRDRTCRHPEDVAEYA